MCWLCLFVMVHCRLHILHFYFFNHSYITFLSIFLSQYIFHTIYLSSLSHYSSIHALLLLSVSICLSLLVFSHSISLSLHFNLIFSSLYLTRSLPPTVTLLLHFLLHFFPPFLHYLPCFRPLFLCGFSFSHMLHHKKTADSFTSSQQEFCYWP